MKSIWSTLLQNHVFANLAFVLVLVLGSLSYINFPRQKDPEINFNWIQIFIAYPGATASDVERQVTNPIEEALVKVKDIRFMSSFSRGNIASILVRFEDISPRTFDKRLNDLRRELQNTAESELPEAAEDPIVQEISTGNAFPSAMLMLSSASNDERLRHQAYLIDKDLSNIKGVDGINSTGLTTPQLQIDLKLAQLQHYQLNPTDISQAIGHLFQDIAAGQLNISGQQWLIRLVGSVTDVQALGQYSVLSADTPVRLEQVADVRLGKKKPEQLVRYQGKPAILFSVTKKEKFNTIALVDDIKQYIDEKNKSLKLHGMKLSLLDDQTSSTNQAIKVMQTNALIGLVLVLCITWLFLGIHMALLTSIGIPFILAGTFIIIDAIGITLNNSVLLAIVISLGMLVDDAVVVVEAIYYRIARGMDSLSACMGALQEVFWPVTTAVATTMASFLPLMLLPGILGKFLIVVPMVVIIALAISLIEAYWMLPSHIIAANIKISPSKWQMMRRKQTLRLQHAYIRSLVKMLRYPFIAAIIILGLILFIAFSFQAKLIKVNFFAMDSFPLFYVTIEMPSDGSLQETLERVSEVEKIVLAHIKPNELRSSGVYAGQAFTETEILYGDQWGQVIVSITPDKSQRRRIDEIIASMREEVQSVVGPINISFLPLKDGPPTGRPINIKVRGSDFEVLHRATKAVENILQQIPAVHDISNTESEGRMQLSLRLKQTTLRELEINPQEIRSFLRIISDGEIVSEVRKQGEKLEVRIRAKRQEYASIEEILAQPYFLKNGQQIALRELVEVTSSRARSEIRHYNSLRHIQVVADLDTTQMNTVEVNELVKAEWKKIQPQFNNVNLDFTGALDDIQESMDAMFSLFLMGLGMMYMILGAQFKSYFQPLLVLLTAVPLAFIGVAIGLIISQNPLSLFTMYGIVALTGIAVNAAIVLMSAAHDRLRIGLSITHATIYAARRRVVPILITTFTTMASLFSLATGLAGESLMWGPVATAIVWGVGFSAILTLYIIPLLFRLFVRPVKISYNYSGG